MKVYYRPDKREWDEILQRPSLDLRSLNDSVSAILAEVKENGDEALRRYTLKFDRCCIDDFAVSPDEFAKAGAAVPAELKRSIDQAVSNIEKFHSAQSEEPKIIETTEGVFCWRKSVAIEKVGLYVPGGTAPLFSTVLMLAVPARLAGCREIIVCSPPNEHGQIDNTILYAASVCGVTKVFKVGGAQAIGALGYGTETIPGVYKIFGPGNQYVTCAKQIVSQAGTAIDMPAGPSEVAVLADETCVPAFVAADLLSQAEHGMDSQVILVSTSESVIDETLLEVERQLAVLPKRDIAAASLGNSRAVLVESIDEGIAMLNEYAPEHLILAVNEADEIALRITNAGSVFLGNYSCESAGDYASGTNHTLPTGGYAKTCGGVSLDSFVKKITFQKLTAEGIRNLGPAIEQMAAAEGLEAHRRAVSIRLEAIKHGI
jgi:histidinol dehydrogenase